MYFCFYFDKPTSRFFKFYDFTHNINFNHNNCNLELSTNLFDIFRKDVLCFDVHPT